MKPKNLVMIGSVMFAALCGFLWSAANHPSQTGLLPSKITWITIYVYLGITALVFLAAIVLKIVNTVKAVKNKSNKNLPPEQ